ncbi:MAG: hypothetical protein AABY18_04785 [Candidatus Thermoplasmatota archaeon]
MTWPQQLTKAPDSNVHVYVSNDEIRDAYLAHLKAHYAHNTYRGYSSDITVFLRMWGTTLVTTLGQPDIEHFVQAMAPKCNRFQPGANPSCRIGLDIQRCPMLLQGVEYTACPGYQPLDIVAIWSYLRTIHSFYEWLREGGYVPLNPVTGPMRRFRRLHKGTFDERRRKPRRKRFTQRDLQRLVHGAPIHRAILYVLMAKCFLRIHEVLKLSLAPSHFNLKECWIDIPDVPGWPGKRQGNKRIIMDGELQLWMHRYLDWRDEHVKRDENGNQLTDRLTVNQFGRAWALSAVANLRTAIHKDCRKVGLMDGGERERQSRYGLHGLRGYATKWARDKRATDAELQVLRGDLAPGAIDPYDFALDRLPELYARLGPQID